MENKKYLSEIKYIKPKWSLIDISLIYLTNGYSNDNYKIYNKKTNEKLFLKIYKNNNNDNNQIIKLLDLNKKGYGSKILHHFESGRIEEWIEAEPLSHDLINSEIIKKIAIKLSKFHNDTNNIHYDLNFNNILISKNNDINFIDFEYSKISNNKAYDIANFFIEWIYTYGENWYNYNLKLFPSLRQIKLFCSFYLNQKINSIEVEDLIDKIFIEINNTHKYWYIWSKKFKSIEYQLYGLNRLKLLNYDFREMISKEKIIYTDGTFDLCHMGHISFFEKIKKLGCRKLIIGVISDENVSSYKRLPIINLDNRVKFLENLRLIDKVIKDCPFNQITDKFLNDNGIDLVIYGGDPNDKDPLKKWAYHYQIPNEQNILKMVKYSDLESTSNIIKRIKR